MSKIFVAGKIPNVAMTFLKQHKHLVVMEDKLSKEQLISALSKDKYDGLLTLLTNTIDQEVMDSCPSLKIIANYAVGYDNIDINYAKNKDIIITNTPDVLTNAVAEHAVTLMASVAKRICESDKFVRAGKFSGWEPDLFLGVEMKGKKLAVLGAGRIGRRVIEIATKGFGMEAVYFDKYRNEEWEKESGAKFIGNMKDAVKGADFVSIHIPLSKSNTHIIDKEVLSNIGQQGILINTARGPLVDEVALIEILQNKGILGAGLDVFENEKNVNKDLFKLDNAILTPHIASATHETREDMALLAANNVNAVLAGGKPITPVV